MTDRTIRSLSIAFTVAILLWGAWSTLAYLGVPVHDAVLLNPEVMAGKLAQLCPTNGLLCRGTWALPALVTYFFVRLSLIGWFLFWAAVFYGAFLLVQAMRTGEWRVRGALRPLHIVVLFLLTLWLFFTVGSRTFGTEGNPMRILYEPLPQVYTTATQKELDVLTENRDRLMKMGCLDTIGQTPHGAAVYQLRGFCVQGAFFTRVLPPLVAVSVLAIELLLLGSFALRFFRLEIGSLGVRAALSIGLGSGLWIALLWLVAQLHLYVAPMGWALLIAVPALCRKELVWWWRAAREVSLEVDAPWWSVRTLVLWSLVAFLAVNFLTVVRPFPIGWDDLGRYINQPRLLVSYGQAIPTMGTFQWEYLTSLGFLLFGYNSPLGATVSMEINWLAGVFAVFCVFVIGRLVLGRVGGVLSALLFYVTPVIGHFSFADMKPDNAVFAVGSLALLAALIGLYPGTMYDEEDEQQPPARAWFVLAGVLAGFAFGFKATAVMVCMAIGALLLRKGMQLWGFLAACFFAFAAFILQGSLEVSKLMGRLYRDPSAYTRTEVLGFLLVIGAALLLIGAWKHRATLKPTATTVGLFVLGFFAATLPWIVLNGAKAGELGVRFSPPNVFSAAFVLSDARPVKDYGQPIRTLPEELQVNINDPACVSTAGSEELDRYWGDDTGWGHYLLLPWRAVLNLDAIGYYVTQLPGFLLFPLLLLVPAFWMGRQRMLRALFAATSLLIVEWVFLANGVPWYGIGMFLGIVIALEAMVRFSPGRTASIAASVVVLVSVCCGIEFRLWQLEQQRSLLEYPMGKVSASVLQERTISHYDDVKDIVLDRAQKYPQSPYVYRMGTFIPYFIPRNLELLPLADNQLDIFNCIDQERNHALTLRRLQALGFSSMIFDTNTATIEKDTQGSLHKKVNALLSFLNDATLGLDINVNDSEAGIVYVLLPTP